MRNLVAHDGWSLDFWCLWSLVLVRAGDRRANVVHRLRDGLRRLIELFTRGSAQVLKLVLGLVDDGAQLLLAVIEIFGEGARDLLCEIGDLRPGLGFTAGAT